MTDTPRTPKLHRPAFDVWLLPEGIADDQAEDQAVHHRVIVNHADQLRAELQAKQEGLSKPQDAPMHLTSLWLWASMVRTGAYTDKFRAFKTECIAYDKADTAEDDPETAPNPTEASTS